MELQDPWFQYLTVPPHLAIAGVGNEPGKGLDIIS